MATSGSINLNYTGADIANEAAEILGLKGTGQALSADDMALILRSLNLMLKTWGTNSRLWLLTEGTIAPLLSTASYALAVKALKITSIRRRISNFDVPLTMLSRQEYFDYPAKASTGTPHSFYYDPQRTTGTVYLIPAPDAGFVANGTLRYTYARVIEDIDAQSNDMDLPQEWFEAIAFNLAARLLAKFPNEAGKLIEDRAAMLLRQIERFDQEDASLFMSPDFHA